MSPPSSLAGVVDRLVRPIAVVSAALVAVASIATGLAGRSESYLTYRAVFWPVTGVALASLLCLALLTRDRQRALRAWLLPTPGIAAAFLAGNGFADGVARVLWWSAAGLVLVLAVLAVAERLETAQNRPVRRF